MPKKIALRRSQNLFSPTTNRRVKKEPTTKTPEDALSLSSPRQRKLVRTTGFILNQPKTESKREVPSQNALWGNGKDVSLEMMDQVLLNAEFSLPATATFRERMTEYHTELFTQLASGALEIAPLSQIWSALDAWLFPQEKQASESKREKSEEAVEPTQSPKSTLATSAKQKKDEPTEAALLLELVAQIGALDVSKETGAPQLRHIRDHLNDILRAELLPNGLADGGYEYAPDKCAEVLAPWVTELAGYTTPEAAAEQVARFWAFPEIPYAWLHQAYGAQIASHGIDPTLMRETDPASALAMSVLPQLLAGRLEFLHQPVQKAANHKAQWSCAARFTEGEKVKSLKHAEKTCSAILDHLEAADIGRPLQTLLQHIYASVVDVGINQDKLEESEAHREALKMVGGVLILRAIAPAIISPERWGLVDDTEAGEWKNRVNLVLVSKLLQAVNNQNTEEQKDLSGKALTRRNRYIVKKAPQLIRILTRLAQP